MGTKLAPLGMSLFGRALEYSKTCLKRPLKKNIKNAINTKYGLMQVKSIAECSKGSILQHFRLSLSYLFPLRPFFCLFISDRLRQVLLYPNIRVNKICEMNIY